MEYIRQLHEQFIDVNGNYSHLYTYSQIDDREIIILYNGHYHVTYFYVCFEKTNVYTLFWEWSYENTFDSSDSAKETVKGIVDRVIIPTLENKQTTPNNIDWTHL